MQMDIAWFLSPNNQLVQHPFTALQVIVELYFKNNLGRIVQINLKNLKS